MIPNNQLHSSLIDLESLNIGSAAKDKKYEKLFEETF